MKAAVFHMPGSIKVDEVPDPELKENDDIIVKVTSTAICGSDLHIYGGYFPQVKNMIMGHEFMGIVEETGSGVTNIKKGDRVVVPFPISCGQCYFCQQGLFPHCETTNEEHYGPNGDLLKNKGGGIFGYTWLYGNYDGGQAEYARVPKANVGPRVVPEGMTDEQVLFLTDIFPTGWTAVDWANLQGGETVAIFGSGPVGLMAQKAAWLKGAGRVIAIDPVQYRLDRAGTANKVETINNSDADAVEIIREMTNGRGADVCIDAVGLEADRTFFERVKTAINFELGTPKVMELCFEAVRRGGTVSIVGVYSSNYDNFPIHRIFDKGLSLRFGQAPVQKYIDELLQLVVDGKVVLNDIVSHVLPLTEAPHAYDIFKKRDDNCVKVILKP